MFEDTKRVSRSCKFKNGQPIQKKRDRKDLQKTLYRKLKIGTCDGVYIVGSCSDVYHLDPMIRLYIVIHMQICLRHFHSAVEIVG